MPPPTVTGAPTQSTPTLPWLPPSLPDHRAPTPARRRRGAVVAAAVAVALSVFATAQVVASLDPITTIDGAADGTTAAVRGTRTQVEPLPPPPSHGGCLTGSIAKVSSAVDAAQRWYVGTKNSSWKVTFYPTSGLRGPIAVVGDSLTLGSETSLMRNLIDAGYGPICVDGGVSRRMTVGATSNVSNAVTVIARIKASDPVWRVPELRWVLGIGTNDARMTNMSTYPTTIQAGLTAIGGGSYYPVWFINVRTRQLFNKPAEDLWNSTLLAPGITIIDWAAAVDPALTTYIGGDFIHLTPAGYDMRGALVRQALDLSPLR